MKPSLVDQDEYETVINSEKAYKSLTNILRSRGSIVFAWTDQEGTQLDILMAYNIVQYGRLQRGMSTRTDLFVAVSDFGMFGFELNGMEKFPSYIGEKLNLGDINTTTEKLAELINGICKELEL